MSTTSMSIEEEIRTAAGSVPDPEIRKTMAQLGMIDEVELREGGNAIIRYHLTSPLCPSPFAISIGKEIRRRVEQVEGVTRATVEIRDHFIAKDIAAKVNEVDIPKDAPPWL